MAGMDHQDTLWKAIVMAGLVILVVMTARLTAYQNNAIATAGWLGVIVFGLAAVGIGTLDWGLANRDDD